MSRTIKKQPKRETPRILRPEGNKKSSFKKRVLNDYSDDYMEEF
jgi:hypothetical protein